MKKVLILDAEQRSALAVTRSLGQKQITVFTASETVPALAGQSKFSDTHFLYPSPRLKPEQFIESIDKLIIENSIDILLPMTELTSTLLLLNQSVFPSVDIPFPDLNTIETLANKCLLMRKAESLNIPIPKTLYSKNGKAIISTLESLSYPIVLKPEKSWVFHNNEWSRTTVRFAASPQEAKDILQNDWVFNAHPLMIQEQIEGYGAGIFAIFDNGRPVTFFQHKRLREKPPSGGVSVLCESIPLDPQLKSHAQKLLEDVNWHGVAMVEFKVGVDGTPYLMEINTRFWGSLQLAIDSGVDFPFLLYQLTCGKPLESISGYKTGIKLRWLLGDMDNLYLTLRNKEVSAKAKLASIINFFSPSLFSTKHEVNRLGDMKPFFHELKQYILDLTK